MDIKPYNVKYKIQLTQIILNRNLSSTVIDELPEFGLVAFEDNKIVAACFFRRIEGSSIVLMDSLITNPSISKDLRDIAQDRLVKKLIKIAKHYNITNILAFTMIKSTLIRSQKHGFVCLPHQVISLEL